MSKGKEPAFPFHPNRPRNEEEDRGYLGLTKRELFAALAMLGVESSNMELETQSTMNESEVARRSIRLADALLTELERETTKNQKESL